MTTLTFSMEQITAWVGSFMWPFFRIGAMIMAAPVFGTGMVNIRVKILLSLLLTWMLVPILEPAPQVDVFSPQGVLLTAQQILLGLTMGFAFQFVFSALTVAGENIAMSMGLGFAQAVDPASGVSVPVVAQFFLISAILLFLALDGHLLLIQLLAESFVLMPVGSSAMDVDFIWQMVLWGGYIFAGALMVALPAITALMAINVAMGVMTRAAPQMNIFSVGFPVTMLAGFVLMIWMLPTILPWFSQMLSQITELVRSIWT